MLVSGTENFDFGKHDCIKLATSIVNKTFDWNNKLPESCVGKVNVYLL